QFSCNFFAIAAAVQKSDAPLACCPRYPPLPRDAPTCAMYNSIMRPRAVVPHIATIIISVTLSAVVATAWTGPTTSPPDGNADAPINVGATTQFKNGNLGLWGNLLLAADGGSYLNFGATSGAETSPNVRC
ncbi:MAG: hypothetical protein ACRD9W_04720, partial [Terriglobia bacterium]